MPHKELSIYILSTSSFPWGMAATTRVKCLAKGLMSENVYVEHIGLCGADVEYSPDKQRSGKLDGVPYSYPGGFAVRSRYWLMRRLDDFLGRTVATLRLASCRLRGKMDAIMLYSRDAGTVRFWSRFAHLMHVPVVLELCEWPLAIAETTGEDLRKARAFCHDAVLRADGVIPISTYIDKEVEKISGSAGKHIPSMIIPILIDVDDTHVRITGNTEKRPPYLLYTGAISYFDIAKLVVDIAASLKQGGIDIPVIFTGGGAGDRFDRLREYAGSKGVLEHVEFTGHVSAEYLAELMQNATALLAPLPENPQSVSRFPTKLGYYLSSGRPVITNTVGDVDRYLQDGVNAYVASGCQPVLFAAKVKAVLADADTAKLIGARGRELALTRFHYRNACAGIREFIESLKRGAPIHSKHTV